MTLKWFSAEKWITGGFVAAIALMSAVSITSYQNAAQLVKSATQVRQTNEVLDQLTDLSATLADIESRRWGYVLFDDLTELEQYNRAIENLDQILAALRSPLEDTPIQQQRFDQLEALINERVQLLNQSIEFYRQKNVTVLANDPLITQSRQNQNDIRQLIKALESKEEELLQLQLEQSQSNLQIRMLIEPLGTLLTFGILLGVYILLYRQMLKRQAAETRQRTLSQEKELSELKLQLFSLVSHEFRTPLSLILGSAQLLDESLKSQIEPSKLKNLYRIQSSAKMMTQLLSDILTLARADAGKLEYRPEWVEVQTFCLNLVEDFQLVGEPKRSIAFQQQGTCTHAYVDEKLLYSILSNLLSNAIKFSPAHSPVQLTLRCEPEAVTFQVQDQGIGIATEEQGHIYDLFTRGQNARDVLGTGLGLAVVKRCVELHGGDIRVESQINVGTTFTVKLPQPAPPETKSGVAEQKHDSRAGASRIPHPSPLSKERE
jgi:signal transduction histidine kinase